MSEIGILTLNAVIMETYTSEPYKLVLFNDNYNTFDHVIDCMILYLLKSPQEAYKIAYTVHIFGKAIIFGSSNREEVEQIYKVLVEEKLTVSIE